MKGEIPFGTMVVQWIQKNLRFFCIHCTTIVPNGISQMELINTGRDE
jgi:hypothetical protein